MTGETLLLRQVHPAFIQAQRVTSQVFRPTPKDQQLLSVYDGDQITAEAAYHHFINRPECRSAGVLAVTCDECADQQLPVHSDPESFPEHVVIDFTGLSNNQCEKNGKRLCAIAVQRGWLYFAE